MCIILFMCMFVCNYVCAHMFVQVRIPVDLHAKFRGEGQGSCLLFP